MALRPTKGMFTFEEDGPLAPTPTRTPAPAPSKPAPETKNTPAPAPAPAPSSNRLFPYVTDGRDLNSGQSREPWSQQDIQMLTEAELRNVFAEDKRLQEQYKNVDNYIKPGLFLDCSYNL